MKLYATRITEGEDLKAAISQFSIDNQLHSGVIVSAVGSLGKARIRMAGAEPHHQDVREYEGIFEIVSLIGTVANAGKPHLHISISDKDGSVVGGHLKDGCIVHTTVELAIASDSALQFTRELDDATGFDELTIREA